MSRFWEWMGLKWTREQEPGLAEDYLATYSTASGRRVLKHMIDSIYATIYEGHDPLDEARHNARRSVVHETLQTIDMAENPDKYKISTEEG